MWLLCEGQYYPVNTTGFMKCFISLSYRLPLRMIAQMSKYVFGRYNFVEVRCIFNSNSLQTSLVMKYSTSIVINLIKKQCIFAEWEVRWCLGVSYVLTLRASSCISLLQLAFFWARLLENLVRYLNDSVLFFLDSSTVESRVKFGQCECIVLRGPINVL